MHFAKQVTIIVPTLNRSHFVNKMLRYLSCTNFGGTLIIADSSNPEHFSNTDSEIRKLGPKYRVDHRPYPGLTVFECLRETAPIVTTPYVLWAGDDDIPVPGCLENCSDFLSVNPEYSAAGGLSVALAMDYPNLEKALGTWRCPLECFEEESAGQRVTALLSSYNVTAYSVSRSEQFLQRVLPFGDKHFSDIVFGNELFNCCMLLAQGKLKVIDRLLFVRQNHQERYLFNDSFDWITSPEFGPSYELFRDRLAEQIASNDQIEFEEAQRLVKQAFWPYISQCLNPASSRRATRRARTIARNFAKRVPFVQSAWHFGRVFLPGKSNQITLGALLRSGSRYHQDFIPVYNALTRPAEQTCLPKSIR